MEDRQRNEILNDTELWLRIGEVAYLYRQVYGIDLYDIESRIRKFLTTKDDDQT